MTPADQAVLDFAAALAKHGWRLEVQGRDVLIGTRKAVYVAVYAPKARGDQWRLAHRMGPKRSRRYVPVAEVDSAEAAIKTIEAHDPSADA